MLDKSIKDNRSNVQIDKRRKDPKKNPYRKDKPYINNIRVDDTGMWDPNNRNQPIMVMGNSMSTEGYGNMPLYVQPNGGNRGFVVPPNVGTLNFGPGVSHFVETPMAYGGDPSLTNITGHYKFGGKYSPTETHMQTGGWLDEYAPGGNVQPYRAKNKKDFDYRQQMYKDSIDLHNFSQFQAANELEQKSVLDNIVDIGFGFLPVNRGERDYNQRVFNYAKNLVKNNPRIKIGLPGVGQKLYTEEDYKKEGSTDVYHDIIKPASLWVGDAVNAFYKKPVEQILPPVVNSDNTVITVKPSMTKDKSGKPVGVIGQTKKKTTSNQPKVINDYKKYLKAKKAYDDSLNLYNKEKRLYEEETKLSYDKLLKIPHSNIPGGPGYGYTYSGKPLYGHKKPVQPYIYKKAEPEPVKESRFIEEPKFEKPKVQEPFKPNKSTYTDKSRATYYWYQKSPSEIIPVTREQYNKLGVPVREYGGDLDMYQPGGSTLLPVTPADSAELYQNTIDLLNYYGNKQNYKNLGSRDFGTYMDVTGLNRSAVNDMRERLKDPKKHPYTAERWNSALSTTGNLLSGIFGVGKVETDRLDPDYDFKLSDYYQKIDPYKYKQRELANYKIDTSAPMQLYDTRIKPTVEYTYQNIDKSYGPIAGTNPLLGDIVNFYGYDPKLIKPWSMLTPQERAKRMSQKPKPVQTQPVSTPRRSAVSTVPTRVQVKPNVPTQSNIARKIQSNIANKPKVERKKDYQNELNISKNQLKKYPRKPGYTTRPATEQELQRGIVAVDVPQPINTKPAIAQTNISEDGFKPSKYTYTDKTGHVHHWHRRTKGDTIPVTKEVYDKLSVPEMQGGGWINNVQLGLDAAQFIPVLGEAAYLVSLPFTTYDVGKDIYHGNWKQAGIDALGYIPGLKAFKYGVKGEKLLDTTSKLAKQYKKLNTVVNTTNLANDARKKEHGGILEMYQPGGRTGNTYKDLFGVPQLNLTQEEQRRAVNPTPEELRQDYLRHVYTKGSGRVEESMSPIDLLGPAEIKAAMSAVKTGAKALPKVAKHATTKTPLPKWFIEEMRFKSLPELNNPDASKVLENFRTRISTPEGKERLKQLGITNTKILDDLKIVGDENTLGQYWHERIGINPELPEVKKVTRHEIEHGVQDALESSRLDKYNYDASNFKYLFRPKAKKEAIQIAMKQTSDIDDILGGLELRKTPEKIDWSQLKEHRGKLDPSKLFDYMSDKQRATNYFDSGSEGKEKSAFLGEVQQHMMDKGIIPSDSYTHVTPEMVKQTFIDAMFDEKTGGKYLRLFNIMKPTENNYNLISKGLNKMLGIGVPAAIGAGALLQKEKNGGEWLDQYQPGGTYSSLYGTPTLNLSPQQIQQTIQSNQQPVYGTPEYAMTKGTGRADYVPVVESLLLPASLPIKAASRLGKAAVNVAEAINPISGLKGTPKAISKVSAPRVPLGTIEDVKRAQKLEKYGIKSDIVDFINPPYQTKLDADKINYNDYYGTDLHVNQYGPTRGDLFTGSTDVPQFNREVNEFATQMQFGKQPQMARENFYTNPREFDKWLDREEAYNQAYAKWYDENIKKQNPIENVFGRATGKRKNPHLEFQELHPELINPYPKIPLEKEQYELLRDYLNTTDNPLLRTTSPGRFSQLEPPEILTDAAKKVRDLSQDWYHKADPRMYVKEMRERINKSLEDVKNMSDEEVKREAEKIFNMEKKNIYDQYKKSVSKPLTGTEAFQMISPNKQGGQIKLKKRKGTSQNIQSSVNDLFMRNELLYGPPGKRRFVPYKEDGGESYKTGGWLDNYV